MLQSKIARLKLKLTNSIFKSARGAAAPLIVVSIIPMIAAMGGAIDLANIYMVRSQMRDAVDNAALAGGRLFRSDDRDAQVANFFNSNLPLLANGNILQSLNITSSKIGATDRIKVAAEVDVKLLIMKFFGFNTFRVRTEATVERGATGMELVLALDNTDSMNEDDPDGGSRIDALRTASIQLINTLYGGNETNPNLWIGVVPYTSMVNVGKILKEEETSRGVQYVDNLPGYNYDPTLPTGWKGCIDEAPTVNTINAASDPNKTSDWAGALDTKELAPGQLGHPLFRPFFAESLEYRNPIYDTGVVCYPDRTVNTGTYEPGVEGEVGKYIPGADVFVPADPACVPRAATPGLVVGYSAVQGNRYVTPGVYPTGPYRAAWWQTVPSTGPSALVYPSGTNPITAGTPNLYCPQEAINLKQRTKTEVTTYLSKMEAYDFSAGTMSNIALGWAYRMLTPAAPLVGPAKTSARPKIIILMTDGFLWQDSAADLRSAYGYIEEGKIVPLSLTTGSDTPVWRQARYDALEARLKRWCTNARSEGMRVYTVAFTLAATDPRSELYRRCASEPGMYFNPQNASDLANAFDQIANSLTNLRLVS
jgi:Flp pilus assembly protein TadG